MAAVNLYKCLLSVFIRCAAFPSVYKPQILVQNTFVGSLKLDNLTRYKFFFGGASFPGISITNSQSKRLPLNFWSNFSSSSKDLHLHFTRHKVCPSYTMMARLRLYIYWQCIFPHSRKIRLAWIQSQCRLLV